MAFIRTIPPEEATDKLKEIYDGELKTQAILQMARWH